MTKAKQQKVGHLLSQYVCNRFDKVHVDLIENLPPSGAWCPVGREFKNYTACLVIVDNYSGRVEWTPLITK